jgi:mediator of RNA polymerase II transcription subunit 5
METLVLLWAPLQRYGVILIYDCPTKQVQFISHLCETQMTMYLKQLSSLLFKKPRSIDVIFQFTSPTSILRPLCQILDDWHYDSDQGECYELLYCKY